MNEFDTGNVIHTQNSNIAGKRQEHWPWRANVRKIVLLVLLGLLWSARLIAIKAAGRSGIPIHVTVTMSVLGIATLFSVIALWRRSWPPRDRTTVIFYLFNGTLGFILPFILENLVAPRLPVFVFVVIISTMPVITLALVAISGTERLNWVRYVTIGLGFCAAVLTAGDTALSTSLPTLNWPWILPAFGVPTLYAINTVFVASRWPQSADAMHVAQAQALIMSAAAIAGGIMSGSIDELSLAGQNAPEITAIVLAEGIALLIYLKITRDFGASFVSFANYIAMVFAAIFGALFFGDQLTWLSMIAAGVLALAITLNQLKSRS